MSHKKKLLLTALCVALLLAVGVGTAVAFLVINDAAQYTEENLFTPGDVICTVDDTYAVINEGNIPVRIRATAIVNWIKDGKIHEIQPDKSFTLGAGWTQAPDGFYYYDAEVAPAASTSALIANLDTLKNQTPPETGCTLSVSVLAEAIQATGQIDGVDAHIDAWKGGNPIDNPNESLTIDTTNIKFGSVINAVNNVELLNYSYGGFWTGSPADSLDHISTEDDPMKDFTMDGGQILTIQGYAMVEGGIDRYVYTVDSVNWIDVEGGTSGDPEGGWGVHKDHLQFGTYNASDDNKMCRFNAETSALKIDLSAFGGEYVINVKIAAVPRKDPTKVIPFFTVSVILVPNTSSRDALGFKPSLENLTDPDMLNIFEGDTVINESVMFLNSGDIKSLMYPIDEIISVTHVNHSTGEVITYHEGEDFAVVDGKLKAFGSNIPFITGDRYYDNDTNYANSTGLVTLNPSGTQVFTYAGGGTTMSQWQVEVTYKHSSEWEGYTQECRWDIYEDFIRKMQNGENVTVFFTGDSITYGADSSFITGVYPYQASYPILFTKALADLFDYKIVYQRNTSLEANNFHLSPNPGNVYNENGTGGTITYVNTAIPGWKSGDAVENMEAFILNEIRTHGCDLFICALGMNDVYDDPKNYTAANVKTIVDGVLAVKPETAVMLVSPMRPNVTSTNGWDSNQKLQEAEYLTLAAGYRALGVRCGVARMTSVSNNLYAPEYDGPKEFMDVTGNNINHPNDFLSRVYAQTLLQTVIGYENLHETSHIPEVPEEVIKQGIEFSQNKIFRAETALPQAPQTVEAWLCLPTDNRYEQRGGVIWGNWYEYGKNVLNFEIYSNADQDVYGVPRVYFIESNGTVHDWKFYDLNLYRYNGRWIHLAFAFDYSVAGEHMIHCYVNGELIQSKDIGKVEVTIPTDPMILGGDMRTNAQSGMPNLQFFTGTLSSLTVYSDTRTDAEISADMEATTPDTDGLLVAYDLSAYAGASQIKNILDSSANGYDLTAMTVDDNNPSILLASEMIFTSRNNLQDIKRYGTYNTYTSSGNDPYLYLKMPAYTNTIQAKRFIAIKYRTKTQVENADIELFISSSSLTGDNAIRQRVIGDGEWHLALFDAYEIIDRANLDLSHINELRLDVLSAENSNSNGLEDDIPAGESIDIAYFGFFDSFGDAMAYEYNMAKVGMSFEAGEGYYGTKIPSSVPLTFESWINLPQDAQGGVLFGNSTDAATGFVQFEVSEEGEPSVHIAGWSRFIFDECQVQTGEWLHLAFVIDTANHSVSCYINGELKQTVTSVAAANYTSAFAPFTLGGDMKNDNARYFQGQIHSLKVYSDMLTAYEIRMDMQSDKPLEDHLLIHYDLADYANGAPVIIPDLSGNGYDVTTGEMTEHQQANAPTYAFTSDDIFSPHESNHVASIIDYKIYKSIVVNSSNENTDAYFMIYPTDNQEKLINLNRYAVVKYRIDDNDSDAFDSCVPRMQLFVGSTGTGPSNDDQMVSADLTADGQWHVVIFDLKDIVDRGKLNANYTATFVRFDVLEAADSSNHRVTLPQTVVDVAYINFFETPERALKYEYDYNSFTGMTFTQGNLYEGVMPLDEAPYTVEAWLKFPADYNQSSRGGVIMGNYYGNSTNSYSLEVYGNGVPRVYYIKPSGAVCDTKFSGVNLYSYGGEWTHLAVVQDGSSLKCYVNGQLKQTVAVDFTLTAPTNPLALGGDLRTDATEGDNAQYFKGTLKSVNIYESTRTAAEIMLDMQVSMPLPDENPMAAYDLSGYTDGAPSTIPDISDDDRDYQVSLYAPTLIYNAENLPKRGGTTSMQQMTENRQGDYNTYTVESGCNDPYVYVFHHSSVTYGSRYAVVKYRTSTPDMVTQIFMGSTQDDATTDNQKIQQALIADGEWHLAILDTEKIGSDLLDHTQRVTKFIRFDVMAKVDANGASLNLPDGASIDVAYLAFFDSAESALNYEYGYGEMKGMRFNSTLYNGAVAPTDELYSVEAWIKLPAGYTQRAGVILSDFDGVSSHNFAFEIHENGRPRIFFERSNEEGSWIFENVNVCTGDWVHVAVVFEGTNKLHCYVNGELKQTKDIAFNYAKYPRLAVPERPLALGGDPRTGNVQYFKGEIMSVAAYSHSRTQAEIIKDMATPGFDTKGLLMAYDLSVYSAGAPDTIPDVSGNGHFVTTAANADLAGFFTDKAPVTDYAYSIAVVGDTQILSWQDKKETTTNMNQLYQWIADNADAKKMQYVIGLGDITQDNYYESEYAIFKTAIAKIKDKVPYSLIRGNHDLVTPVSNGHTNFKTTAADIGYSAQYDGCYNNEPYNTYKLLTVGEVKYMILNLDYGPDDAVLTWANNVVAAHPDYNVIVNTHAYLYRDGTTLDATDLYAPTTDAVFGAFPGHVANNGDHMWDEFVSLHENIVLVLCGHDPSDKLVTTQTKGKNGNTVTQMLVDLQGLDKRLWDAKQTQSGMVTMLYFSEDGKQMQVECYSTLHDAYYLPENQFTVTIDTVEKKDTAYNTNVTTKILSSGGGTPGYHSTGSIFGKAIAIPEGQRLKQLSFQTTTGAPAHTGTLSYAFYAYNGDVDSTLSSGTLYTGTATCTDWGFVTIDIPEDVILKGNIMVEFVVSEGYGSPRLDSQHVDSMVLASYYAKENRAWNATVELADWDE